MASKVETAEAVEILSGNEAIARGAWEAGVKLAAAYPGTPSTEILEALADYEGVYCEWSPNEKVAMEVGIGASMAGGRALVCMKHVGLNVAADPFFSSSYVGLEAGLVVVSADDPGMHSSQDEQDNRNYAKFARVPLLEPSDSGEAKEFMMAAYELSERFDTPVLFRTTTRTSHSKSMVKMGDRNETKPVTELRRDWNKYLMMPANAIVRHRVVEQRVLDMAEYAETARSTGWRWAIPAWASSPRAPSTATPARPCRSQLPEAGHDLSPAEEAHRRLPLQGGQALRGRGARPLPGRSHPAHGHQDRRRQGTEHAAG